MIQILNWIQNLEATFQKVWCLNRQISDPTDSLVLEENICCPEKT